jgi:hypothetical protein
MFLRGFGFAVQGQEGCEIVWGAHGDSRGDDRVNSCRFSDSYTFIATLLTLFRSRNVTHSNCFGILWTSDLLGCGQLDVISFQQNSFSQNPRLDSLRSFGACFGNHGLQSHRQNCRHNDTYSRGIRRRSM